MVYPWQGEALFAKAQRSYRQNRLAESVALYRRALQKKPRSAGVRLHLALALAAEGDYPAALDSIRRAMALQPKNPVYPVFLGLIHYDHGYYDAAIAALDQAALLDSDYQYPSYLKDLAFFTLGRFEEAYARLGKNYHWGSDFESRLLLICELYLKQHAGEAVSFFQSEFGASGAAAPAYDGKLRRLRVGLRFGFRELIQRIFRSATVGEAERAFLRAEKYCALGDFPQARTEYHRVLQHPDSRMYPKALQQTAEIALGTGDFESFLGLVREIPEYRQTLDFLDDPSGRPASAAAYPALQADLLIALGIVYYETGETARAQDALLTASRLDPQNYLCYYYLGLCDVTHVLKNHAETRYTIHNFRAALFWFTKALDEVNPAIIAKRAAETMRVSRLNRSQPAAPVLAPN